MTSAAGTAILIIKTCHRKCVFMKVSMFKFYKTNIFTFAVLGGAVILVAWKFAVFYVEDNSESLFIRCISVLFGVLIFLFPFLLYHKQLTHAVLTQGNCTTYSMFGKKLYQVEYDKPVYYTFFDVHFARMSPVKFVALSNVPFSCMQTRSALAQKSFYGTYDRTQVAILPYDDDIATNLHVNSWHCVC